MINYLIIFCVFSFLGSLSDTAYRFWVTGKYFRGQVIPFFAPPYGLAAVALVFINNFSLSFPLTIFWGTFACVAIEFISGLFCVYVLKKRLWDYSASRWNLWGYIDATHTLYWFVLTILFSLIFKAH